MNNILEAKPMMSDEEIQVVDSLFEKHKFKRCLEWGSGGSTIYFPRKHDCIEEWYSIEHNGKYVDMIKRSVEHTVALKHVKLEEYLAVVKNRKFDFILIDGLMRQECLTFAEDLLNRGGVILLHDASRPEFQKPIKEWSGKTEQLTKGEGRMTGCAHRGIYQFTK